ncbi:MAG: hypothetical protein LQ349_006834 [Xanthoria aureola]|nr:MAG: hypothetical protein LQ349_006834 [Xanthoria aureola]
MARSVADGRMPLENKFNKTVDRVVFGLFIDLLVTDKDQLQDAPAVDSDALRARLQSLSSISAISSSPPPLSPSSSSTTSTTAPNPGKEMERDRFLETQARQQLEQDGCPLYYPAGSLFPVQYPPDQYKKIISYWVDHPRTEGGVFCAQWDDWQRFRSFQERNRHYYKQRGGFARFMTAVRERRRRHHLSEDVRLNCHREQQTPLETWLEFQNYHVHTHEEFGRRAQIEAANLRTAQVTLDGATASEAERAALNVKAHSCFPEQYLAGIQCPSQQVPGSQREYVSTQLSSAKGDQGRKGRNPVHASSRQKELPGKATKPYLKESIVENEIHVATFTEVVYYGKWTDVKKT